MTYSSAEGIDARDERGPDLLGWLRGDLSRGKPAGKLYFRRLWDYWWREREGLSDCILPGDLWRFSGVRPANNPQRRLALAARWVRHFRRNRVVTQTTSISLCAP